MADWTAYVACAGGVVLSCVLPVLAESVRKDFAVASGVSTESPFARRLRFVLVYSWQISKPYAKLFLLSLLVALLIVAFEADKLGSWRSALLLGYTWDSTLQKFTGQLRAPP